MTETSWLDAHLALILCIAGCTAVTLLSKLLPVTFLKGDNLPLTLRHWLSFVPVAVMAALVGPDVFIYEGQFNLGPSNLFLMAGLPTLVVAWWYKNYFLTIVVGIGLVILARFTGLY